MSPDLKELRAFVVVADTLHFGRAAVRLNTTPPPLTRRIQKLERQVGVMLFDRMRRSVALTPAGRLLLNEVRPLLQGLDGVPDRLVRFMEGRSGELRIGIISVALATHGQTLNRKLAREMPGVRVFWRVLSSGEQAIALQQGLLDAGILHTPLEASGLATRRVGREALAVALPTGHPFAARRTITLQALRNEVFLVGARDRSPGDFDRLIVACHAESFVPRLDPQTQPIGAFVGLVAIGAGVALTPVSLTEQPLAGTSFVRLAGRSQFSEISLAWDPARVSPALSRVLGWAWSDGAAR